MSFYPECEPFLQLEIHGKPSYQYENLPIKFNNYGLKINDKDCWIDNDGEMFSTAIQIDFVYDGIDLRE